MARRATSPQESSRRAHPRLDRAGDGILSNMSTWQPVTCDEMIESRPRRLHWQGEALLIVDYGRRWTSERGEHLLVRVQDGRVFELLRSQTGWYALLHVDPPGVV